MIYEWLKGIDAVQACRDGLLDKDAMALLVERCHAESRTQGIFRQRQQAPAHHRAAHARQAAGEGPNGPDAVRAGRFRTAQDEHRSAKSKLRAKKRQEYLIRQARRFEPRQDFPEDLTPVSIMGVDYVYGQVESTGGALWVVGRDPMLFDYFLPEKWRRTPRTQDQCLAAGL